MLHTRRDDIGKEARAVRIIRPKRKISRFARRLRCRWRLRRLRLRLLRLRKNGGSNQRGDLPSIDATPKCDRPLLISFSSPKDSVPVRGPLPRLLKRLEPRYCFNNSTEWPFLSHKTEPLKCTGRSGIWAAVRCTFENPSGIQTSECNISSRLGILFSGPDRSSRGSQPIAFWPNPS